MNNKNQQNKLVRDKRTTYDDSDCSELVETYSNELSIFDQKIVDQVRKYLGDQRGSTSKFSFIKQNGIIGVAYHPDKEETLDVCRAYLYQIKNRHIEVGYIQKLALHQFKSETEVLSYYLKLSTRLQNTVPAEQLYGNVTLEIKIVKGQIKHVKAVTTYYSDSNYKTVRDWQEWYSVIFLGEKFDL